MDFFIDYCVTNFRSYVFLVTVAFSLFSHILFFSS